MYDMFFKKVHEKVTLSPEEEDICKTFLIPKKVRKKQYFLQEGDVCKYSAFVEKGVLRSYTIDEKGHEHIVQFAIEGWWISDMYSFITGEPSVYNIDVIEDAELLLLTYLSQEELLLKVPKFERYIRLLIQGGYIALQRRLVLSLSQSAEEKYIKLTVNYPHIIQRVPQHMIASYLGITPETLSRIRKQISERNHIS
jgi:CRP-like cAMP-binding protein